MTARVHPSEKRSLPRLVLLMALLLLSAPYGTTRVGSEPAGGAKGRPGETIASARSLSRSALFADPASGTLPIVVGDTWRYLKGTAAPPANWNTIAFDHSAWATGPSGFGYGDSDDATVLNDMQNGYVSVYIRRLFDVVNPATIAGLTFTIDYDDGFVAYLNGTEVARRNVSGTPPSYNATATASHEASAGSGGNPATTISLDAYVNLLVAGTNVLAIQGHNVSLTSTDLSLIPSLQATNPPPTAPAEPDSPADGSSGASSAPNLCVTVHDANADPMTVTFKGRESTPSGADFTIIVLPDAQYYPMSYPAVENAQMQWIVANRVARNIVYVSAVGDSTNDNNSAQWVNVSTAFAYLENPTTTGLPSGIPYGITLGNHDQTPIGTARTGTDEGATTTLYNQTFGKDRFCPSGNCRSYFGENYTFGGAFAANMDNYYQLFNADGMEFIAFHLEWDQSDNTTRQAVLAWMRNTLLNVYPNRRAIITTHYLINPGDASWSDQGLAVYNTVKDVPSVFAMFCGHLDQANMRTDTYNGHTITTMVSDYQSRPNGGNGWLRILTFTPADNSIHVQTYSPYLDQFINNHADNTAGTAKNDFTLPYTMSGGSAFETIGTVSAVPDGAQACVSWPGRLGGRPYEWYVEISDGTSTTTSSRWTFTPDCASGADCDDNNACTTDACSAGICTHTAISGCGCSANADCDNGNACDGVETCSGGSCLLGTTPNCNDGNLCTTDSCDPANGCVYANNTLSCSDGNNCTSPDACSGGACVGVYNRFDGCCAGNSDCNDGNPATLDRCTSGNCSNTPSAACVTSADCADDDACTTDSCSMSTNTANTAALSFNGSTQYVTFGNASELGLSRFTVETWFKRTGSGTSLSTGTGGITVVPLVAKGSPEGDGSNVDANYILGINTSTNVLGADFEQYEKTCTGGTGTCTTAPYGANCTCAVNADCQSGVCGNSGLNRPVSGTTVIANNTWYHAAATYDGTTWRLYLNGNLEATLAYTGTVTPRYDSIQPAALGTMIRSGGTANGFFQGVLDEVRIWNYARSQADIQRDKALPLLSGTGLVARWGVDEGTGSTISDSVGPPNTTGTLTNAPTWVTDHPDLGPWFCSYVTTHCSDGDPCTLDVCDNGSCSYPINDDGTPCDDGNACTSGDACASGVCQAGTPNTGPCDDGDPCTSDDACSDGTCSGGMRICCTSVAQCDDGQVCTTDACASLNSAGLEFDGSNDYVTFGTETELGLSQFTIETWFKRTGTGVANTTGSGGITSMVPLVAKGAPENDGGTYDANYVMGINTAGNVLAADFEDLATGLNHPVSGTTPITNNTWYHAAASYDGTTWRLYLNGNLEATLVVGSFTPRSDSIQPAGLATMQRTAGYPSGPWQLGFFQGLMDEVRIWNLARSQTDISRDMFQQITSGTGLVARWGLNEGTGTTVADSVGAPNTTGTLTNGPTWQTLPANLPPGLGTTCTNVLVVGSSCSDGNACNGEETCNASAECVPGTPPTCDDANNCTTDTCSGGACGNAYAPTPGCCTSDTQCDDGVPETADTCLLPAGNCRNVRSSCATDADCDDAEVCTSDTCVSAEPANTGALSFNGSSQYVRTANSAPGLNTATFTIEAWIKWDGATGAGTSVGSGGLTSGIPLVAKGRAEADASNVDTNYFFGIDSATKKLAADFEEAMGVCSGGSNPGAACSYRCSTTTSTVCSIDSQCPSGETCTVASGCTGGTCIGKAGLNHPVFGKTAFSTTPTAPWVTGWNHVAVTYDGSCWTLYVNGTDDTDVTSPPIPAPKCPGVAPRSDNIVPLGIATALTSGGTAAGFFGGQIDEVRIWNLARSQAQIQATKNRQVVSETGLIGQWSLNEGTGTSAADTAGPTNENGALTGGPAWVTGAGNLPDLSPRTCAYTPIPGCCTTDAQCDDGNPCTTDACNANACTHASRNQGGACDDNNACTQTDTCLNGVCVGSNSVVCDDGKACTDDSCNPANGACVYTNDNTNTCTDGNACTQTDTCSNGTCVGSSPVVCNDNNACTDDSCNPATGSCVYANDNTNTCTDGNACTQTDACVSGFCIGSNPIVCNDSNACTDDGCNPATGSCVYTNDNTNTCADANACTGDACVNGACVSWYAPTPGCCSGAGNCNDGNAATTDSCALPAGNCSNVVTAGCTLAAQCNDSNGCTTDACVGAVISSALNFDGTNDYVTMGAAAGETALGARAFTLEGWIRRDGATWGATTTTGGGGLTAIPLITKGRGESESAPLNTNYFLGITAAGRPVADFEQQVAAGGWSIGQNHPICSTGSITDQNWHHIAVTYSVADGWRMYLDGLEGTTTEGSSCATGGACSPAGSCPRVPGVEPEYNSTQHFALGSALTSSGTREGLFAGMMDEVRVWNVVRTPSQIADSMNQEIAFANNLIGRWGLNENSGTSAADSTSPAQNGTLTESTTAPVTATNGPAWAGDSPLTILGTCASTPIPSCSPCSADYQCNDSNPCTTDSCNTANEAALQFDGVDDYVTMGPAAGTSQLGAATFTLETWFYWTGGGVGASTGTGGIASLIPLVTKGAGEGETPANLNENYILGIAGGKLAADFEDTINGQNHPVTGTASITTNTWNHAAASYDGTTWRLYLNGNLDTTLVVGAFTPESTSIQHFGLGSMLNSTGARTGFFQGRLDEVRVWNVARSLGQIQADRFRELSSAPNLIGRWSLNDGATTPSTTTAVDSSGRGNHGTLGGPSGLPIWSTTDLQVLAGFSSCRHVDATNGTTCTDGNPCTQGDTCQSGACTSGGAAPSGTACGSSSHTACDNPDTCDGSGVCRPNYDLSGVACEDGYACTTDTCDGAGQCLSAASCGVGGTVRYYRDSGMPGSEPSTKPVPNVGIDADNDGVAEATSLVGSGAYALGNLAGDLTVTPLPKNGSPRAADHNGAVSSLDASRAAMAAVGNGSLSTNQVLAGDVTGNGSISALDASYIARFSAELVNHFPVATARGSDWKFLKCTMNPLVCGDPVYAFAPLGGNETADFYGILYGDVTGDWAPTGGFAVSSAAISPEERQASIRDRELADRFHREGAPAVVERRPGMGAAELSLLGWKPLRAGERAELTVNLGNADGILGLDLVLTYDPSRIAISGVQAAGIGSALSVARSEHDGTQRIAAYGYGALSGSGTILTITVQGLKNTGGLQPPTIDGVANEGTIPLEVKARGRGQGKAW